ncbi:hypothetical protein Halha_2363 [Halobacteroides halobius DSM 5150]|uniref:Uncharacterized protein n=1 Tax=Halobacteroides halobius (strain ATCC 35273 / DSM 5150 / MD-1) TaxID=748449 RepID=L0KAA3_HALHC|nr:hypothetical protein [Halobacteroides halobius]AGB42237.1 hypothetical protein Halha_2363 [Halobacteroides halobius DSM 5150]
MKTKSKRLRLVVLCLVLVGLAVGCARNPRGNSFGPAWDVAYKVPLIESKEKVLGDVLREQNLGSEIVVPKEGATDTRIKINQTKNLASIKLGEKMTDITWPTISSSVDLPLITLGSSTDPLIPNKNSSITLPSGKTIPAGSRYNYDSTSSTELNGISIDLSNQFSSILFSANTINKMDITVTNATGLKVENLALNLTDAKGNKIPAEITSIADGSNQDSNWDLQSTELSNLINASIKFDLVNNTGNFVTLDGSESLAFDFSLPQAEVSRIEGYDLSSGITFDKSTSIHIKDGLQSIGFNSGNLDLAINSSNSTLNFTINQFNLGSITSDTSSVDLTGQEASLSSGNINIEYILTVSGSNITYDASQSVAVTGSFSNPQINYVTIDKSSIDFSQFDQNLTQEIMSSIPDKLSKLSLNNATMELVIDHSIKGLYLDLTSTSNPIKFVAKADGSLVDEKPITELTSDSTKITASNSKISLNVSELITWLQGLDSSRVDSVVLAGAIKAGADTSPLKVSADSVIAPQVKMNIPFDFTLNQNIEDEVAITAMGQALTERQLAALKSGIKEARLIIGDFENQLPINLEIKYYAGTVSDWATYDNIKNHLASLTSKEKEDELDKLYKPDNLVKTFTLDEGDDGKKEFILRPEAAEVFTQDNVYTGIKYIIKSGNVTLNTTDLIKIEDAYLELTTKVNQFAQ